MSEKVYHDIPEEDRRKAQVFFDRGKTVADTGNFEYAIEMYIQGLNVDPENIEAHQALREIAMKRKASGGKPMGFVDKMKLQKAKDDKTAMLNAEKLLGYDPGSTDQMLGVLQNAQKAGFYETVLWIGPVLLQANANQKKSDFKVYIALADVYAAIDRFHLASEAANYALAMRPDDMELGQRMKNYAAEATMKEGNYGVAKSFRESVRNRDLQDKLLEDEKDVHTIDALEAARSWKPRLPGRPLRKTIRSSPNSSTWRFAGPNSTNMTSMRSRLARRVLRENQAVQMACPHRRNSHCPAEPQRA